MTSGNDLCLSTTEEALLFASIADECFEVPTPPPPQKTRRHHDRQVSSSSSSSISSSSSSWSTDSTLESSQPPEECPSSSATIRIAKELMKLETDECDGGLGQLDETIPTADVVEAAFQADPDDLDALLASEMKTLSIKERDQALRDVHGIVSNPVQQQQPSTTLPTSTSMLTSETNPAAVVAATTTTNGVIVEDEEFLDKSVQQLDDRLKAIKCNAKNKEAYERAVYQSPEYVQDRKFRLMFLRANSFHIKRSAQQIIQHFHEKLKLFGKDLLTRDIRLSDLTEEERKLVYSGDYQILSKRDHCNRTVWIGVPKMMRDYYLDNIKHCQTNSDRQAAMLSRNRVTFYMSMRSIQDDEETQKSGIVFVLLDNGVDHSLGSSMLLEMSMMRMCDAVERCIPYRVGSCHYCFDDQRLYPFASFFRFVVGKHIRQRYRIHYGSRQEQSYALQTYGIPTDAIPFIDENGILDTTYHMEWINQVRMKEEQEEMIASSNRPGRITASLLVPRRFDVLFGRGNVSDHTGNLRAFHIVHMHRNEYEDSDKFGKTLIAERIVKLINSSYGRFLRYEKKGSKSGFWIEVSQDEARNKISHFFRRIRELEQKKAKKSNNSISVSAKSKKRPSVAKSVAVV